GNVVANHQEMVVTKRCPGNSGGITLRGDTGRLLRSFRRRAATAARVPVRKETPMLWALIVILVVMWFLGFVVIPVGGALIHLLLVIALIVLIYPLIPGRRSL